MPQPSLLSLLTESDSGLRRWYFGFCENRIELPWWMALVVKHHPANIQHVYAFTQVGDYVLFIEPMRDRIEFTVKYPEDGAKSLSAEKIAYELSWEGHIVARHDYVPRVAGRKTIWNWIPSCVTVIKCATGFSSFAITPRGFLRDLLGNGAKLYMEKS